MGCLSVFRSHEPTRIVANPIFLFSRGEQYSPGDRLEFEVLEADADALKPLVGKQQYFVLDGTLPAWGQLEELQPCVSTHPGLKYLRAKPTLRGVLSIFGEAVSKQ
jgi:hypothetical protein